MPQKWENGEMIASSNERSRAVVLLSGGLDSTTTLAVAQRENDECLALTFRYGQKHEKEVQAARTIAASMDVKKHIVLPLNLGEYLASALTDGTREVPKNQTAPPTGSSIPATYVPARNTIFLACALAVAETTQSGRIYTGVSSVDYSGYPDCRPEFIRAFQNLADVATKRAVEGQKVEIRAPLLTMDKADTIRKGIELGVDYSLTISCYGPDGKGRACGMCDACRLRRRGFKNAGIQDPTSYLEE